MSATATRAALERSSAFESERIARALSQQLARTGSTLATELDPIAVLDEVVGQADGAPRRRRRARSRRSRAASS